MRKKRNFLIFNTVVLQISLLMISSFAIAFIFSENLGSAEDVGGIIARQVVLPEQGPYGPIYNLDVPSRNVLISNPSATTALPTGATSATGVVTTTSGATGAWGGVGSGANFLQGAQVASGGAANVIAAPQAASGILIKDGVAYAGTWSPGVNAWEAGAALTKSQLGSISAANSYFPGMTAADASALGWAPQTIGSSTGQSISALVSPDGKFAAALNPTTGQLTGQTAAWNAATPNAATGEVGSWVASAPKAPATSATGLSGVFSGSSFGTGTGFAGIASSLFSGLVWGAIVGGAAYFLAGMFGLSDSQAASVGLSAGAGTFAGTSAYFLASHYVAAQGAGYSGFFSTISPGFFGLGLGIGIGVTALLLTYKEEKKELVRFECLPWEPPTGGQRCDECNDDSMMPCSEYRCKSLGQACEIVNPGTEEEKCVWVSKGDTAAPHMEPWNEALSKGLRYVPDTAVSPPNRGFKVVDSAGSECLPAFSTLEFGITTDEPAQCKIDYEPRGSYEEMQFFFGETNLFLDEHAQKLPTPGQSAEGEVVPELGTDGTYQFWVRCIDANGNGNDAAAVAFRYCVDAGPDTIQPKVEGTDVRYGMPVSFGQDNLSINVYVNEPANCKWSRIDKAYEAMENEMSCLTETYQTNADLNYVCSGQLTGIKDRGENWFYFRCEDLSTAPGGKNVMATSYPFLVLGTEELTIKEVGPTGEFKGSTSVVSVTLNVETAHGANEGEAVCSFSTTEDIAGSFVAMDNTESYLHNQTLDLGSGYYTYYFRCIDAGGNLAMGNTNFTVAVDTSLPSITRVFKDGNSLKLITNEEAKCYYSLTNCDYSLEDGLPLIYENPARRDVHTAEWNDKNVYHIKCEDYQDNQPSPNKCQIIVQASEL